MLTRRRLGDAALVLGVLVLALGGALVGHGVGQPPPAAVSTTTLHRTTTIHHTRTVTVRVRARVLRRSDHVVTVLVPRIVIHTRHHTFIVRRHIEHINHHGGPSQLSAIVGASPVTVTVPVYVPVTVTTPPVTVSEPASTVTETASASTVTVTVVLPPGDGGTT